MKSSNRFLIGLITAAITFSILLLTLGPRRFEHKLQQCKKEKQIDQPSKQPEQ